MLQKSNLDDAASLARDTPRLFVLKRLESTCDAFEERWKQTPVIAADSGTGSSVEPDLREFLSQHDLPDSELFLELLQIDIVYRRRIGLSTELDDYARRFPEYSDVIQKVGQPGSASAAEAPAGPALPGLPVVRPIVPDRYRLEQELGKGSFGVVWKAWDTQMGRSVAVKCLRHDLSPAAFDLLAREAHAVSQMSHPNVVRALDAGKTSRGTFIVFELVDGISLQDWAKELPKEADREQAIARMVLQISQGLQHIHDQGVVHRDLKPGNILVTRQGVPKIIDFGLSKYEDVLSTLTGGPEGAGGGALLGTVPYMSPEQCLGRRLDATTDVYSLGVILFELLTGERPFDGGTRQELIQKILNSPTPRFEKRHGISKPLESICLAAMSRNSAQRYPSASALANDLARFLNAQPVSRRRLPLGALAAGLSHGRKAGVLAMALLVAGLLAHSFGFLPRTKEKPEVIIETVPAGAAVSVIPIDRRNGQLYPEQMRRPAERSPVSLSLPPGDYLIVAALTDGSGRFHEVYRHVPTEEEAPGGRTGFRQIRWTIDPGGDIRLPAIEIPEAAVTEGMVRVEGTSAFDSGIPGSRVNPPSRCSIPTFFVDPREFTLRDYRRVLRGKAPANSLEFQPDNPEGSVSVSFEEAIARAEDAGKRLLEESEFEFVSTARGAFRFPWGDGPIVGDTTADRFESGPAAILNLCSGHAEWTDTARTTSGPRSKEESILAGSFSGLRAARGGGAKAFELPAGWDADDRDPRTRTLVGQFKVHPGVGFRCARSAAPRLNPSDFVKAVPYDNSLAENQSR